MSVVKQASISLAKILPKSQLLQGNYKQRFKQEILFLTIIPKVACYNYIVYKTELQSYVFFLKNSTHEKNEYTTNNIPVFFYTDLLVPNC